MKRTITGMITAIRIREDSLVVEVEDAPHPMGGGTYIRAAFEVGGVDHALERGWHRTIGSICKLTVEVDRKEGSED